MDSTRIAGMPGRNAGPVAGNIAQLAPTSRGRPVVLPTRRRRHRAARKVRARTAAGRLRDDQSASVP